MVEDPDKYQIKSRIIPHGKFPESGQKKLEEFNSREPITQPVKRSDFMKLMREVSKICSLNIAIEASMRNITINLQLT
jgi:hypothetical protein